MEQLYSVSLFNSTLGSKHSLPDSYLSLNRTDLYSAVMEISAKNPKNLFLLTINYLSHTCNRQCNGQFHHEVEEEREETWKLMDGDWIDE